MKSFYEWRCILRMRYIMQHASRLLGSTLFIIDFVAKLMIE